MEIGEAYNVCVGQSPLGTIFAYAIDFTDLTHPCGFTHVYLRTYVLISLLFVVAF